MIICYDYHMNCLVFYGEARNVYSNHRTPSAARYWIGFFYCAESLGGDEVFWVSVSAHFHKNLFCFESKFFKVFL